MSEYMGPFSEDEFNKRESHISEVKARFKRIPGGISDIQEQTLEAGLRVLSTQELLDVQGPKGNEIKDPTLNKIHIKPF